ncbi:MAG: hypothetical protein R2688_05460 [Fimbriimonadaceae bacterium]
MKMTWPRWIAAVYGVILIAIGVQSYFFPSGKPSIISLIASGLMGVAVLGLVKLSLSMPRPGYIGILFISVVAGGRFVSKMGDGFYPAQFVVLISVVTAGALLAGHMMAMKAKKSETTASE